VIVHPPAGIVGGDRLTLEVIVGAGAQAQLTTPGAAKWYRSAGTPAQQRLRFSVGSGALLEWLPHETIVFDGAIAELDTQIALAADAIFIGWEIVCLGRRLAGERYANGRWSQDITIRRGDARQWVEKMRLEGSAPLLDSPVGLRSEGVFGTFYASRSPMAEDLIIGCRKIACADGDVAVTSLPGILLARYRGSSSEAAREYFAALWMHIRPMLAGREATRPRIWNT